MAPALWFEPTGDVLGQPFFVMGFVQGAELADERAMDEATAADFVRILAELHAIDWTAAGIRPTIVPDTPSDATHLQIERWADISRSAPLPSRSR